jgi:hypothetical protein
MVCGNRQLPWWARGPATEELCCTVQRRIHAYKSSSRAIIVRFPYWQLRSHITNQRIWGGKSSRVFLFRLFIHEQDRCLLAHIGGEWGIVCGRRQLFSDFLAFQTGLGRK